MEVPQYKPLSLMEDFKPSKTCKEYVEQDCTKALSEFRPHSAPQPVHGKVPFFRAPHTTSHRASKRRLKGRCSRVRRGGRGGAGRGATWKYLRLTLMFLATCCFAFVVSLASFTCRPASTRRSGASSRRCAGGAVSFWRGALPMCVGRACASALVVPPHRRGS